MKLVARYAVACVALTCAAALLAVLSLHIRRVDTRAPALKILPRVEHSAVFNCPQGFFVDADASCRPCSPGMFTLPPHITVCVPLLSCDEISRDISGHKKFSAGGVKTFFKGRWTLPTGRSISVLIARPHPSLLEDFDMGRRNLAAISQHPLVIKPIGTCDSPPMLVLPYLPLGSAQHVDRVAEQVEDPLELRLQLVEDYARILVHLHLHASTEGSYVMCDAATLDKLLSQFLISDDYRLILNDVDALPLAKPGHGIKCGHRELSGHFVAPEQRWPHHGRPFNDEEMQPYDEKVDIWRVPETVAALLGCTGVVAPQAADGDTPQAPDYCQHAAPFLWLLEGRCKRKRGKARPNARWVLDTVQRMRYMIRTLRAPHVEIG